MSTTITAKPAFAFKARAFGQMRLLALLLAGALALIAGPVAAQNPFAAAVRVNDSVITNYEIAQREAFLRVLNAQGDVRQQAIDALIEERLQLQAAGNLGVEASPAQIEEAVAEFAGRFNLSAEQFITQMGEQGISPETLRDFIGSGVTWRAVIGARFGSQATVSEAEIDRALELGTVLGGGIEVLLAEIVIPVTPQNQENLEAELARLGDALQGDTAQFSEAARRFSAAPTREDGGLTGWRPIGELPEGLQDQFLTMGAGRVIGPLPLGGGQAFALFQMRGQREVEAPTLAVTEIDYAAIAIPGGRSAEALAEAARIRAAADTCLDLNGVIPGGFERQSVSPGSLPSDVAGALRALDDNEMSTSVTRNGGSVLLALMLCDRVRAEPEVGRDAVRQRLIGQRMNALGQGLLDQLRAEARISFE